MTSRSETPLYAPLWIGVTAALGAGAVGALVAVNAILGLLLIVAVGGAFIGVVFAVRLPALFLRALAGLLIVYAILGKAGGYFNLGGIFVGELVLAFGVLAVVFGGVALVGPYRSTLVWVIVAFAIWGAVRTAPYVSTYGMDAFRDAVVWGYGAYALLVAGALARTGWTRLVVERYGAWLLWFPALVPVIWVLAERARERLPLVPGSNIPLVHFKSGDAAFHLIGVAAFVLLGLHGTAAVKQSLVRPGGWLWWTAWFLAFAITGAASRASILAILAGGAVVLALRPSSRLWRPILTTLVLSLLFVASGIRVEIRAGRYLSATEMVANFASIGNATDHGNRDATRGWRLEWWGKIIDYTIRGPYFWTGKGFGINLADDDGFQVEKDSALRSPHNGHLTILARSGVPGLVLWLVLQGGFAVALLRAYRRTVSTQADWWARVILWILACWVTFLVNAAFEVSLEGPHGGIWFWSLFGLGLAVLEVQRRAAACSQNASAST